MLIILTVGNGRGRFQPGRGGDSKMTMSGAVGILVEAEAMAEMSLGIGSFRVKHQALLDVTAERLPREFMRMGVEELSVKGPNWGDDADL